LSHKLHQKKTRKSEIPLPRASSEIERALVSFASQTQTQFGPIPAGIDVAILHRQGEEPHVNQINRSQSDTNRESTTSMRPNSIAAYLEIWVTALSLAILLLAARAAHANGATVADWRLDQRMATDGVTTLCVISTDFTSGSESFLLEVHKQKNKDVSAEVLIRRLGDPKSSTGFITNASQTESRLSFSELSVNAQNADQIYWMIPRNNQALVNRLNSSRGLEVSVQPSRWWTPTLNFSTRGFRDVRERLEKACNDGRPLFEAEFDSYFLAGVQRDVDVSRIGAATTKSLRDWHAKGWITYQKQLQNKADKEALRAEFGALESERSDLLTREKTLVEVTLPDLQQQKASNLARQNQASADLSKINSQIPALQAEVNQAQATRDQKKSIIAPFEPEHQQLSSRLYSSQQALEAAQREWQRIQSRHQILEWEINQFRQESMNLASRLSQLNYELDSAQREWRERRREADRFDSAAELRDRLRHDRDYANARQYENDAQRRADQARIDVSIATGQRDQAQAVLNQCQNANPKVDCSAQAAAAQAAQSRLDQVQREFNQADQARAAAKSRADEIERRMERQVRNEHERLRRRERDAQERVLNTEREIRENERRSQAIATYEIPTRTAEIARLLHERAQTEVEIERARSFVEQHTRELAQYETRVDWASKKSALDRAESDLVQKQTRLSQAVNQKAELERVIALCRQEDTRLARLIAENEAELSRHRARIAKLNQELASFDTKMGVLDERGRQIANELASIRGDFEKAFAQLP